MSKSNHAHLTTDAHCSDNLVTYPRSHANNCRFSLPRRSYCRCGRLKQPQYATCRSCFGPERLVCPVCKAHKSPKYDFCFSCNAKVAAIIANRLV